MSGKKSLEVVEEKPLRDQLNELREEIHEYRELYNRAFKAMERRLTDVERNSADVVKIATQLSDDVTVFQADLNKSVNLMRKKLDIVLHAAEGMANARKLGGD